MACSCSSASSPHGELFEGKVEMKNGYIVTDDNMKTNIPAYSPLAISVKSLEQVVTAAADGAIAATQAEKYIEG